MNNIYDNLHYTDLHVGRLEHVTFILNTRGLHSHSASRITPLSLQCNLLPGAGGRKDMVRLIPSTVYTPLLYIQMYSEIPTKAGRNPSQVSITCAGRPRCRCLDIGSMHVFELDISTQISLLEVCLSQIITRAVIGHLATSGKGSIFNIFLQVSNVYVKVICSHLLNLPSNLFGGCLPINISSQSDTVKMVTGNHVRGLAHRDRSLLQGV
jgi:hypothetical protein